MNIASVVRKLLPKQIRPLFRKLYRRMLCVWYWGHRVACPCCDRQFRSFRPYGTPKRHQALCPYCGALERQRLLWLFLKNRTHFFQKPLCVLHVAPPTVFLRRFQLLPHDYLPVDLNSPLAQMRLDVMHLPFDDASFDVILCNHVLEHVWDDRQAIKELYRVMKLGGWAILQVPIDLEKNETFEVDDPARLTDQQRIALFGQKDHVRQYGLDYRERLEQVGFSVEVDFYWQELGSTLVAKHALMCEEPVFFCHK